MGWLTGTSSGALDGWYKAMNQNGEFPSHVVSNPNFSSVRIQIFDSLGNLLQQRQNSNGTLTQPEEIHLTLEFSPILA